MTVVLWKDKEKIVLRYFEPFMMAMGILGPLATAPQLVKLYFTHSQHAGGLSLSMWVAYSVLASLWIIYGLVHMPPIWLGNVPLHSPPHGCPETHLIGDRLAPFAASGWVSLRSTHPTD